MTSRQARPDPRRMAEPLRPAPPPSRPSGRRISPGIVFLAIALVGSAAYALYAVTVREASQIPLLASGAVVLAIAFAALAAYCLRATWRAGQEARGGRALGIALVGGIAAIVAAGCLAGALILFQLSGGPG